MYCDTSMLVFDSTFIVFQSEIRNWFSNRTDGRTNITWPLFTWRFIPDNGPGVLYQISTVRWLKETILRIIRYGACLFLSHLHSTGINSIKHWLMKGCCAIHGYTIGGRSMPQSYNQVYWFSCVQQTWTLLFKRLCCDVVSFLQGNCSDFEPAQQWIY